MSWADIKELAVLFIEKSTWPLSVYVVGAAVVIFIFLFLVLSRRKFTFKVWGVGLSVDPKQKVWTGEREGVVEHYVALRQNPWAGRVLEYVKSKQAAREIDIVATLVKGNDKNQVTKDGRKVEEAIRLLLEVHLLERHWSGKIAWPGYLG